MEEILNPGFDFVESVKSIGFDAFFFEYSCQTDVF